jgi:putative transposase
VKRVAREPRIEVPQGIYHVGSKGNRGCEVYADDHERRIFLKLLEIASRRYGWRCHSYCLMSNHYHLLIQLQAGGLSAGMQLLNGWFARISNRRHGYDGHLFKNRFWSELIDGEGHLLEAARYIVLNPVRAGICSAAEAWPWSSYRACAGLDFAPAFLAEREHLQLFGRSAAPARRAYRRFVGEGVGAGHAVSDTGTDHAHRSRRR